MSQIAPDVPELRGVPEATRSVVWMRATAWVGFGGVAGYRVGRGIGVGLGLYGATSRLLPKVLSEADWPKEKT